MTPLSQDTDPKSVADVLDAAADLLSKPGAWTQGAYARDADGKDVNPTERVYRPTSATCFCIYGAIAAVCDGNITLWARISPHNLGLPDTGWNDEAERTQDEVVSKLREAAQAAREAQS